MPRTISTRRVQIRDFGTAIGGASGTNNAQVDMGNVLDMGTSDFSVSVWINPLLISIAGSKTFVGKKNGTTTGLVGWLLCTSTNTIFDKIRFLIDDGVTVVNKTGLLNIKRGLWNHTVVTFNRTGNGTIYLNGTLDVAQSIATVGSVTNVQPFRCLRDGAGNNRYGGAIDELRLFNKVLSLPEIQNLYYDDIVPSGLIGEWLFDEGSGTTANDTSGGGNNGTISVATYTTNIVSKPRTLATNRSLAIARSLAT